MTRILLRSGKDPFQVLSPEHSLALYLRGVFGRNVGNLVFADAVHKIVSTPGTTVVSNSFLTERVDVDRAYVDRINNEFDVFVVPLANAFRRKFLWQLRRLTAVIENLRIPVVVVGAGVAGGVGSLENPVPTDDRELREVVSRFVRAVLDHSASFGVRGEFTREYLGQLGFGDQHVDVIGCPSLFRDGPDLRVNKKQPTLERDSRLTINISPYVPYMGPCSVLHAERYPNLIYVPQGDETLEMMLWGTQPKTGTNPTMPLHTDHVLYRTNRMRFFVDTVPWMRFLAEQVFSFGTRIHGNIVAVSAGTPAHVLAHDARTLELARYHEIPHTLVTDLHPGMDAAELYQATDFTAFNAAQADRFARFADFLTRNGIGHIFEEGKANPEYDRALAATPYPPGVETLFSDSPEAQDAMVARVAHLYRHGGVDRLRKEHQPQFPFPATSDAPPVRRGARLTERAAQLTRGRPRLRRFLTGLRRRLSR